MEIDIIYGDGCYENSIDRKTGKEDSLKRQVINKRDGNQISAERCSSDKSLFFLKSELLLVGNVSVAWGAYIRGRREHRKLHGSRLPLPYSSAILYCTNFCPRSLKAWDGLIDDSSFTVLVYLFSRGWFEFLRIIIWCIKYAKQKMEMNPSHRSLLLFLLTSISCVYNYGTSDSTGKPYTDGFYARTQTITTTSPPSTAS